MTEERDITDPDPEQQDPESGPASDEEQEESTGDQGLDRQVDGLKHHGDKLEEEIEDVKRDWEAKQDDSRIPGAVKDDPAQAAQSERGEAPESAGQ